MSYLFIFISVCMSAFSQVILRYGMTRPEIAGALAAPTSASAILLAVVKSPYVVGGLACYGLGAILWLLVLSKIPVSLAYPFVSLGIVLTTVTGVLVLKESISLTSSLGVVLIIGGIMLVAAGRTV